MPKTREKLIELLRAVQYQGNAVHGYHDKYIQNSELADHLIANGVTFAKDNNVPSTWISVKERLPEPFVSVLVQMPGEQPFPTVREGFISKDVIWQSAMFRREPGEVTHWMPLPEPPKGE